MTRVQVSLTKIKLFLTVLIWLTIKQQSQKANVNIKIRLHALCQVTFLYSPNLFIRLIGFCSENPSDLELLSSQRAF